MHNLVKKALGGNFLIIFFCTLLFFPSITKAFTVLPAISDAQVENRETIQKYIEITNDSDAIKQYSIQIGSFSQHTDGTPTLLQENTNSHWLTGLPQSFELGPKEKKSFTYFVTPNAPRTGSYFFTLFVNETEKSDTFSNVQAKTTIASLLFLNVGHDNNQNLLVTSFAPKSTIVWSIPQKFVFGVKNNGKIFAIPQGELRIAPLFFNKIYAASLVTQKRVLPDFSRTYEVAWNPQGMWWSSLNPFRFGIFDVDLVLQNTEYSGTLRTRFILLSPSGILLLILIILYTVWRFVYYKKSAV